MFIFKFVPFYHYHHLKVLKTYQNPFFPKETTWFRQLYLQYVEYPLRRAVA